MGGKTEPGIPPDPQRVQGASGAQEPLPPLRPPQRVVRPVPLHPWGAPVGLLGGGGYRVVTRC